MGGGWLYIGVSALGVHNCTEDLSVYPHRCFLAKSPPPQGALSRFHPGIYSTRTLRQAGVLTNKLCQTRKELRHTRNELRHTLLELRHIATIEFTIVSSRLFTIPDLSLEASSFPVSMTDRYQWMCSWAAFLSAFRCFWVLLSVLLTCLRESILGLCCILQVLKGDEAKPTWLATLRVQNNLYTLQSTELPELLQKPQKIVKQDS